MELQVYVDTNVYLSLLASRPSLTDDMSKFLALCQNASLELLLPQQTEEEYLSNREDVVAHALEELRKSASIGGFPPLVQNHEVGSEASQLRKNLATKIQLVERWYAEAAKKRELPFDDWFEQLKATATRPKSESEIITRAQERAAKHLPPGKGDDLGDRLIWECLLEAGDIWADLHLITTDEDDFRCPLDKSAARSRLQEDWSRVNLGNVILYSSLEQFLQEAGQTEEFQRAADVGRAVWVLTHQSEGDAIRVASEAIEGALSCLSMRQASMIARAARTYFDRVFITDSAFDRMISEFYRLYAKHLTKDEEAAVRPAVAATEELGHFVPANSNDKAA